MQAPCQLRQNSCAERKFLRGSKMRIKGENGKAERRQPFREVSRFGVQIRERVGATWPGKSFSPRRHGAHGGNIRLIEQIQSCCVLGRAGLYLKTLRSPCLRGG